MQGATMWSGKKMKSSMKRCTDDDKFMIVKENVLGPTILQFFLYVHAQSVSDLQLTATVHTFFAVTHFFLLVSFSHENVCDAYFSFFSRSFLTQLLYFVAAAHVSLFLRSIQPITLICFTCPTYLYYQLCKSTLFVPFSLDSIRLNDFFFSGPSWTVLVEIDEIGIHNCHSPAISSYQNAFYRLTAHILHCLICSLFRC